VSPNAITLAGLGVGLYVVYNLAAGGSMAALLLSALLREVLDIADGVVARTCNTASRAGALLDVLADTLYVTLLLGVTLYAFYVSRNPTLGILCGVLGIGVVLLCQEAWSEWKRRPKPNSDHFIAQNTVVVMPLLLWLLKCSFP
jgi:phosphatidylglycerophosphate synthase